MAISLAFGVLVATGFTLLVIPAAMLVVDDLKQGATSLWRLVSPAPAVPGQPGEPR